MRATDRLVDPWETGGLLLQVSTSLGQYHVSESGRLHAPFADLAAGPVAPELPDEGDQHWCLDDELLARIEEREGKEDGQDAYNDETFGNLTDTSGGDTQQAVAPAASANPVLNTGVLPAAAMGATCQ